MLADRGQSPSTRIRVRAIGGHSRWGLFVMIRRMDDLESATDDCSQHPKWRCGSSYARFNRRERDRWSTQAGPVPVPIPGNPPSPHMGFFGSRTGLCMREFCCAARWLFRSSNGTRFQMPREVVEASGLVQVHERAHTHAAGCSEREKARIMPHPDGPSRQGPPSVASHACGTALYPDSGSRPGSPGQAD